MTVVGLRKRLSHTRDRSKGFGFGWNGGLGLPCHLKASFVLEVFTLDLPVEPIGGCYPSCEGEIRHFAFAYLLNSINRLRLYSHLAYSSSG